MFFVGATFFPFYPWYYAGYPYWGYNYWNWYPGYSYAYSPPFYPSYYPYASSYYPYSDYPYYSSYPSYSYYGDNLLGGGSYGDTTLSGDTTSPSATTQAAQPTLPATASSTYLVGFNWGQDLRRDKVTWDQFVDYVQNDLLQGPASAALDFHRGFVVGYGTNGEAAFAKAVTAAQQTSPDSTQ